MTTLQFIMLLSAAIASAVSAVLHVVGLKSAGAEKAAEDIDSVEAVAKPLEAAIAPPAAPANLTAELNASATSLAAAVAAQTPAPSPAPSPAPAPAP